MSSDIKHGIDKVTIIVESKGIVVTLPDAVMSDETWELLVRDIEDYIAQFNPSEGK